jgi:hypothetical protein
VPSRVARASGGVRPRRADPYTKLSALLAVDAFAAAQRRGATPLSVRPTQPTGGACRPDARRGIVACAHSHAHRHRHPPRRLQHAVLQAVCRSLVIALGISSAPACTPPPPISPAATRTTRAQRQGLGRERAYPDHGTLRRTKGRPSSGTAINYTAVRSCSAARRLITHLVRQLERQFRGPAS